METTIVEWGIAALLFQVDFELGTIA